jgi:SpoVK/Ycf46/Vps4 family AAA+-type ATPase
MTSGLQTNSFLDRTWDRCQIVLSQLFAQGSTSGRQTGANAQTSLALSHGDRNTASKPLNWINLSVEIAVRLIVAIGSGYALMYMSRKALEGFMNPDEKDGENESATYRRLSRILDKRQASSVSNNARNVSQIPPLNHYERIMAQEVVHPDDIATCFSDIGGLDEIKKEIFQLAILPLVQPHLFQSKLVEPTKGILLFGKPGCGKTMLAKALAKEAQAVFIPLQLSKVLSKWVGESNKLVAATFSLAHKLQPCILFVDELDTFLKANHESNAYLDSIKAEFLTLWDGISTNESSRVLVLGATNQPQNIDFAILRRMPRAFEIPLPDSRGRLDILTRLMSEEKLTQEARDFLPELANATNGYSGSDLKELCKAAAMIKIHEYTADFSGARVSGIGSVVEPTSRSNITELRRMTKNDLVLALQKVKRTGAAAKSYGEQENQERQQQQQLNVDMRALASLLHAFSNLSNDNADDDIPDLDKA